MATAAVADRVVFPKRAGERVEIWAELYRGECFVHARVYHLVDGEEWRPTRKGLSLRAELTEQVAEAMLSAARGELNGSAEPA